jgi:alpha-tubulin suppressor-like RCC1 family protein
VTWTREPNRNRGFSEGRASRRLCSQQGVASSTRDVHHCIRAIVFLGLCGLLPACGDGIGPDTERAQEHLLVPTLVSPDLRFTNIAASGHHTCAVATGGRVYCWGGNAVGELATAVGMETCRDGLWGRFPCTGTPVQAQSSVSFVSVAATGASGPHTCALSAEGSAYCWGFGLGGQLGDGSRTNRSTPVAVAGGHNFVSLSKNFWSPLTCALTADQHVYCWGVNSGGQLGNGIRDSGEPVPVRAASNLRLSSLSLGNTHACGISIEGVAYCWGGNWYGELGIGTSGTGTDSFVPVRVRGEHRFRSIVAGDGYSCALVEGGQAYCWGASRFVGSHQAAPITLAPALVAGGHAFSAIFAGPASGCGLSTSGDVYCWGANMNATLGDGSQQDRQLPVKVAGGISFAQLSPNPLCGIAADGRAYCWGGNWYGQAGGRPFCLDSTGLC